VQTSIITERSIDVEENRIMPGNSLIIGGIRKTEKRSVIRGVPFLKDIPLIGILFSSKDFEEKATEIIFILTPSISSGGIEYAQMVEKIRKKNATPKYTVELSDFLTDPFGTAVYTDHVEQQAAQAEFDRLKSEIEKAEALEEVSQIKARLLETAETVLAEKAKASKARAEASKARAEALKARRETGKLNEEIKAQKDKAQKALSDAKEAKVYAERAAARVEQVIAEAEKAHAEEVKKPKTPHKKSDEISLN